MSVVNTIDTVTEWVQKVICDSVMLKMPPDSDRAPTDAGYAYQLVTPQAFSMYVPTKDRCPTERPYNTPSVCVSLMSGADDMAESRGKISVQLTFSAWDPGEHGADVLVPVAGNPGTVQHLPAGEMSKHYRKAGDGWRDAWNFVDVALRAVERTTNIDGLEIDRSEPVKFGPVTEQDAMIDFYPFWFAWISFSVKYPLRRNAQEIEEFL